MTLKEAVLKSLEDINDITNYLAVLNHIIDKNYYDFGGANVYDLKKWFNLKQKNPSVGSYEITANRIYFSTTSNEGTVVYDGQVNDKYYLELSAKSLINGYLHQEKYYFIKVSGLK
ncbi:MAG: hypothetical protein WDM90_16490 [Ferruginibacter sp.]